MKRIQKNFPLLVIILAVLLVGTALLALRFGSAYIGVQAFVDGIFDPTTKEGIILHSIRIPRVFGAVVSGAGLAVSGVILQSVTDNPLASPNIIGVNAGAGFAVILCLFFIPSAVALVPFAAFFGALLSTLLIVFISGRISASKITVVLCGIAFTAVLNAGISLVSLLDSDVLTSYNYFSIGGLSGVRLNEIIVPAIFVLISIALALLLSPKINLLMLGGSMAVSLGVNVRRLRMLALIIASLSAGAAVSFVGLLGFVGLIVPHIARKLVGGSVFKLIITSSLLGGVLVAVSDLLGRILFAPSELPVGIIMSLIGAPFFFILLIKGGRDKNNA